MPTARFNATTLIDEIERLPSTLTSQWRPAPLRRHELTPGSTTTEFVISVETRIAGRTVDVSLLLHGHLGAGPGICARRLVVGFRLVLARLLSIAALRFASRQSHSAVAIGFCDGHIVGLVCGVVVEFNLL